jgi:cell division protein FtsL
VFVALVGFVLVATGVIWRRSLGSVRAREQQQLEHQREALEAERARLEGDIREASSLARLAPVVEARLNMHLPASDSQVILLQRPARRRGKE